MAFPATITLTINAIAKVLDRVNDGNNSSEYLLATATESFTLKIRQSVESVDSDGLVMKRHNVFFEHIVYPTPTSAIKRRTVTVTVRNDRYDDPALATYVGKAVTSWLGTSTNMDDLVKGAN